MKQIICLSIVIAFVGSPTFAHRKEIKLGFDHYELISSTNAFFNSQLPNPCWQAVDPTEEAEIIYRVNFPKGNVWESFSLTGSYLSSPSPGDYLFMYCGRTGADWRQTGQHSGNTSDASMNNSHLYLRAVFLGENAKAFSVESYTTIVIPEPMGVMPIVSAVSFCALGWRRTKKAKQ